MAPTTTSTARLTATSTSISSTSCSKPIPFPPTSPRTTPATSRPACPIEEIARRGRDTLRFGPMKPMGLDNPRTGRRPWAVVQLRQENLRAESFNLVGFQNHMKFGEQARVLRLIPGLEKAEFLRYGQIHRNTYINAPALLTPTLQLRTRPDVFFAGQISGVEGYVESIATGLMAGMHAAALAPGESPRALPRATALGSLCHYVSARRPEGLPAREYHLRPAAAARRGRPAALAPRQEGAPRTDLPAGAGRVLSVPGCRSPCPRLNSSARSASTSRIWHARAIRSIRFAPTKRTCASSSTYLSPPDLAPPEPEAIDLLCCASGSPRSTPSSSPPSPSGASSPPSADSSDSCCAKASSRSTSARLVRTPKAPQKLPEVMTAEQVNVLIDGVAAGKLERPFPVARPRHLRTALRLRHPRQRTRRSRPRGYRPVRWVAPRPRQGQKGTAGAAPR